MNPYRRPPLGPAAEQAIREMVKRHGELTKLRQAGDKAATARTVAVKAALAAGASLREVGDALGMTGEAVRQMVSKHGE